jgi:hypothetical protein
MGTVAVEATSRVLEEHLDNIEVVVGDIVKPVGAREVATSDVTIRAASTTSAGTTIHGRVGYL